MFLRALLGEHRRWLASQIDSCRQPFFCFSNIEVNESCTDPVCNKHPEGRLVEVGIWNATDTTGSLKIGRVLGLELCLTVVSLVCSLFLLCSFSIF